VDVVQRVDSFISLQQCLPITREPLCVRYMLMYVYCTKCRVRVGGMVFLFCESYCSQIVGSILASESG